MRAALDPNILVSALISPEGTPAQLLRLGEVGEFELVVSEKLIAEFARALEYPRLRSRIDEGVRAGAVAALSELGRLAEDPEAGPSFASPDPGDTYLLALVEAERVALVTGDKALQALAGRIPVFSPRKFLELLDAG